MAKRKDHASGHHLTPSSRGGKETVDIPADIHCCWHKLFGNATPEEAKNLIDKYWTTPEVDETIVFQRKCVGYFKR